MNTYISTCESIGNIELTAYIKGLSGYEETAGGHESREAARIYVVTVIRYPRSASYKLCLNNKELRRLGCYAVWLL
jgi:hypothetical protein